MIVDETIKFEKLFGSPFNKNQNKEKNCSITNTASFYINKK